MPPSFFWSEGPNIELVQGKYDLWLVLLSLGVSCIASNQALRLAALAREAEPNFHCFQVHARVDLVLLGLFWHFLFLDGFIHFM